MVRILEKFFIFLEVVDQVAINGKLQIHKSLKLSSKLILDLTK